MSDRYWLLTWTTYGTWLPGDERGFVSNIDAGDGTGHRRNLLGTEPASKQRGLRIMAQGKLRGPPIFLTRTHADLLIEQFLETSGFRNWELLTAAIMANHIHLVVGVPGDPDPEKLLQAFKSYGSRKLNKRFGKPVSETWWTESGSRRKLPGENALTAARSYVRNQEQPLLIWETA